MASMISEVNEQTMCKHGELPDDECYNVDMSQGIKSVQHGQAIMLQQKDFVSRLKHAQAHGWIVVNSTTIRSCVTTNNVYGPPKCEDWAQRTNYIMIDGVPDCYVLPNYFWFNRAICPAYD